MTRSVTAGAVLATMLSTTAFAVETRTLTFEHAGATLVGTLYLPEGHAAGAALPTVVVTGAWTTVQEQMPRTYAMALAERGFAAVTFDFRGWGRSGDLPGGARFVESPLAKIEDIRAAFAHVASLSEVDGARLHGLGICASAGYMVDAAAGNPLVTSVGLVAPWLQNAALVDAVYGGPEGVSGLTALSRQAEAAGGVVIPAAGEVGEEGVLMPLGGYYTDPARGAVPEYDNRWNQASWEGWLTYLPADHGSRLDKPLVIVHSEAAAIPDGVRAFLATYAGEAAVSWLENVGQFDFYDRPEPVTRSVDAVAAHFRTVGGS